MYSSRYATIDDVADIVDLVQSAYRGEASRAGWTTEADLLDGQRTDSDEVTTLITQPDSHILLCEQKDELLASMHLHNRQEFAYLGMFAVRPQCQGQGVGKYLLEQAEHIAFEKWRVGSIQMTVIIQREDLIAWYRRRGYHPTGELRSFPYGDPRFGLPKRDDLILQVLSRSAVAWP